MEPNRLHREDVSLSLAGDDSSPAFVVDAKDLCILTANDAASLAFGYDAVHLVGTPIAALVVSPDEHKIREHIRAVAQLDGIGESSLHATILHADGSVGTSRLEVAVDPAQAPIATVVLKVGGAVANHLAETMNGNTPDPGTAAWLVQQINRGALTDSDVGAAIFHARTCRLVAANRAYARLLHTHHGDLGQSLSGAATSIDGAEGRGVHAVRLGEIGTFTGPQDGTDAARSGRYIVCGLGVAGVAPTYFSTYVYPPGDTPVTAESDVDVSAEPSVRGALGLLAAIVDERWHLRLVPRYSRVLGTPKEIGESVLPLVHPNDLPVLLELGQRVRSGELNLATMSLETRGPAATWTTIDVEITRISGGDPAPWLAILYSRAAEHGAPMPSEDWEPLLLLTHPELSSREREVARALLSGYRVTTIARHLFLSPSTVRNHLSSMFHKVGVESQAELIERFHLLRHDPFP